MPLLIFVDSDVVISSLISSTGAAHILLHETKDIEFFISNYSIQELEEVTERLHLNTDNMYNLIKQQLQKVTIRQSLAEIKTEYEQYVTDIDDAHIVAGTVAANAQFLLSHNQKHYKSQKIKEDFSTILITPANLMQYLRSK